MTARVVDNVPRELTPEEAARRDALVGRLFQAGIVGSELLTVYLGDRLGLYRALAQLGPATSSELAARGHA